MEGESAGKKVRIILLGNFHYNGILLNEDEHFITIQDKYGKRVSLNKTQIEMMEVSENGS